MTQYFSLHSFKSFLTILKVDFISVFIIWVFFRSDAKCVHTWASGAICGFSVRLEFLGSQQGVKWFQLAPGSFVYPKWKGH